MPVSSNDEHDLDHYPACLFTFGLGWLVGAGADWYWGALFVLVAGYWQHVRAVKHNGTIDVPPEEAE